MKHFILFMIFSIQMTGCTAIGESGAVETDVDALDGDMQEYVQNEEITNIMHITAQDGDGDYIVFYAPGAAQLTVEETQEGFLDIRVEQPDDAPAEILHIYELDIGTDVEALRYYINDEETHVEVLAR
ncbi:hypothetical protein [Lacicoccus alkaliphilus]|uniref:Uncharacterized protein n=1 Tax=Lacicoccus alkaliphilus DSM 16010 TaxID=1123231 RepID=A0A1M7JMQ1_9BACL|nr:hypothetical protein [Salinicoccus alkaliphilus]SHM53817.1 hypothetical protein SAMN02745189_02341 [Salinicoccus alkaliphilus DSM 16010]